MTIELSTESTQFVSDQIGSGRFASQSEVIEAGLELLRDRIGLVDRLAASRRQLDAGQSTEYDQDSLGQLFHELKQTARASQNA